MDADKRLTALKKAYADIILNTAKEAAARIMVSERKSLRFQHELSVAKEEALQMLLRLKQMMDSKISEAEMTSLSQQRKIEEVEAQLQEAEDIVRDLREELREVQAELEKVTNNKVQHHLDECDTTPQEETSEENRLNISQSIIFPAPLSQHESIIASDVKNSTSNLRYEGLKCCSDNDSCMGNSYVHSHYLPSTIMRSKEPDLYRNGCTQRIRAFERNLLDGELSLSRHSDDVKSETREDEGGKGIYMTSTHKADNMFNIENKLVLEDKSWCQFPAIKPFRRKRSIRFKKITSSSCRYLLDQVMKRDQPSDPSCFKTHPSPVNNNAQCGKDLYEMAPRSSSDTTEMGMQRECAEATESEAEFVKAGSVQNTIDKDKVLVDKLVLMGQESGTADSSWDQVYRIDVEKVDVPLVNSESKPDRIDVEKVDVPLVNSESKPSDTTNEVSSQPVNHRIIKYTFQRKRKKECLSSSDGNASLEKCTLKRKTEERENGSLGSQKSSSITESTRDSQQLVQVACQLMSLSEKKRRQ